MNNVYFRGAMCDLPMYRKYFRLRGKPPSLDIDDTFYINWFGQSKSANVIEFEGLKRGNLLKWYPSENKASIRDLDNREILRTTSGLFGKRSWTEVNGTTQPRNDQDMIFTQATKIKHSLHFTSKNVHVLHSNKNYFSHFSVILKHSSPAMTANVFLFLDVATVTLIVRMNLMNICVF